MPQRRCSARVSVALPTLLLGVLSANLKAQDFEGIITARVKSMQGGGEMKTYLKGGRYRMEMSVPGQGAVAIIVDPAAGETYMLMPAQSMYMVMKMSDAERMADSLVGRGGSEATMSATGRKEEVAGHTCEYYRFRAADGKATDICMATGLGMFRGGAAMFGGMPRPGRPAAEAPPWIRELMRKGAFPLKVTDTTGAMIWEVVSLESKTLDPALFTPPANYQRMEMPRFGRPPAN
jgi:hypothetical protein